MTTALEPILSPILVGRDEHLELADARLQDALAGRGSTLLVAGEAGIGKTRLLRSIGRRAQALGVRWVQGDLAPQDANNPAAILLDLFRTLRIDPELVPLSDELLERFATASRAGGTYSRTLMVELMDRLRTGLSGPTLLIFEDLQWADDLSLEAIGELARHVSDRPVLLIGAYRLDETPPGTPFRDWRGRLLTQRLATEVKLERLTPEQTATMTTLLLATGMPAPRDVSAAVHARSNGLPLHIEELIAGVRAAGPVDADAILSASVPDTIEDMILARAARRSSKAQEVARAGAVLGRCFVPEVLAGVMDLPVGELDDALKELVDHAILYDFGTVDAGFYDFRHQLLRDALYRSTPERERRRYHARAGEFGAVLEGQTEVHSSLHFERAGLREQAYQAAIEGARAAVRVSAHREAFELYRRAVANMPDTLTALERAELLEAYADQAGAVEQHEATVDAALAAQAAYLEADRPAAAATLYGVLYTIMRRNGEPLSARRRLVAEWEAILDALPPSPEHHESAQFARIFRLVNDVDANDLDAARRTYDEILATLGGQWANVDRIDANSRLAMARIIEGDVDGGLAALTGSADEARAAGYEETGVTAYRDAAVYAIRSMEYGAAARALEVGLRYADSIQQSHCAHVMAALHAELEWASGRWDAAVDQAGQAIVDHGCRRAPNMARWPLGYVHLGRGEVDEARRVLDEALAFGDRSEMIEWRLPPRWGLAEAALIAGEPARAIALCEEAFTLALAQDERALLTPFVVTGVRAYQAAGRPADAERWLAACTERLAPSTAFARPALEHGQGLVSLAAGSTGVARTCLETAVAGWDERGRIWEACWARLDLAAAMARSNRHAAAVALAGQVRETAARLPSPLLVARADELVRTGRGRVTEVEPWHPLTAREFEVARLIGEGYTNGEIADALGIAPKTASSHVEHILAKLGASRRAEIATWTSTVSQAATR
jgi:DNA-binding CsgD family transcriptional regulator/tetratricopeptide (TPR) repeat protein